MLNRVFEERFRSAGRRTALVFGDDRWTYAELEDQVARCAGALKGLGVTGNAGVALVLENCPLLIFSYLASSRLGAPAYLLDPGSKHSELYRIFSESRVALAICEPSQQLTLEKVRIETNQRFVILVRGTGLESAAGHIVEPAAAAVFDSEPATVQYTSGTTGIPKCIVRSHRNLLSEAANFNETTGISTDDHILCPVPLFHSHGFSNAFLGAMYAGATLVLMERFNRAEAVEIMERERITVLPAVPLMFELFSQRKSNRGRRGTSLRLAFSAGAPLPSKVAKEFKDGFGVYVRQLYGATEVGAAAINTDIDPQETLESVGLPLRHVRIDIFREERGAGFARRKRRNCDSERRDDAWLSRTTRVGPPSVS